MQSRHSKDSAPTETIIDPTVMVSMFDEHLVICAPTHLDFEMTNVLVIAAASALGCGSTVMIDLDPDTASDELIARRPADLSPFSVPATSNSPHATVTGPSTWAKADCAAPTTPSNRISSGLTTGSTSVPSG